VASLFLGGLVFLFLFLCFFSSNFNAFIRTEQGAWLEQAYEYRAVFARDNEPGVGPGNNIPKPKNSNDFTFAIMGDTQMFVYPNTASISTGDYPKAVSEIATRHPEMVMTEGDLSQSCHDQVSCDSYRIWKNIDKPLLPITFEVMGNHDREGKDFSDSQWRNYFNLPTNGPVGYQELTYSFNFGNSHFVVLDSEHPLHEIDQTQQVWLDQDLTANTQPNVFVFYHETAWPMDYKRRGQSLDAHSSLRNSLWSIIDKHNVTAVFNGHEHVFSLVKIDSSIFPQATHSIYQIVSGHVDATVRPKAVSEISPKAEYYYPDGSYVMVNVNNRTVTVNLYAIATNQLVKSFTL
jgi:hypothetical protein